MLWGLFMPTAHCRGVGQCRLLHIALHNSLSTCVHSLSLCKLTLCSCVATDKGLCPMQILSTD